MPIRPSAGLPLVRVDSLNDPACDTVHGVFVLLLRRLGESAAEAESFRRTHSPSHAQRLAATTPGTGVAVVAGEGAVRSEGIDLAPALVAKLSCSLRAIVDVERRRSGRRHASPRHSEGHGHSEPGRRYYRPSNLHVPPASSVSAPTSYSVSSARPASPRPHSVSAPSSPIPACHRRLSKVLGFPSASGTSSMAPPSAKATSALSRFPGCGQVAECFLPLRA